MNQEKNKRKKTRHTLFWIIFLEVLVILGGLGFLIMQYSLPGEDAGQSELEPATIAYKETELPSQFTPVPKPDISDQLLTVNDWSRPGKKIKSLDYIVIHYLGNPNTTAQQNHDYFESLKDLQDTSMSANYVVGLKGEIIHCVPDNEVAYASNQANNYSISVENCHPDATGKFTQDTYNSLVHLVGYLSDLYGLGRDQIIRHYDVTGKICPKYFVEHPKAWEKFLDDVMAYRQKYWDEYNKKREERSTEVDELTAFLESNAENEQ